MAQNPHVPQYHRYTTQVPVSLKDSDSDIIP